MNRNGLVRLAAADVVFIVAVSDRQPGCHGQLPPDCPLCRVRLGIVMPRHVRRTNGRLQFFKRIRAQFASKANGLRICDGCDDVCCGCHDDNKEHVPDLQTQLAVFVADDDFVAAKRINRSSAKVQRVKIGQAIEFCPINEPAKTHDCFTGLHRNAVTTLQPDHLFNNSGAEKRCSYPAGRDDVSPSLFSRQIRSGRTICLPATQGTSIEAVTRIRISRIKTVAALAENIVCQVAQQNPQNRQTVRVFSAIMLHKQLRSHPGW